MIKRVLLLVACFVWLLPLITLAEVPPRPTTAGFVFDYQQVIHDDIEKEINDFAYKLQQQGIMELFILTVPTIGDIEPYEYGVELFRQWGIGDKEKIMAWSFLQQPIWDRKIIKFELQQATA